MHKPSLNQDFRNHVEKIDQVTVAQDGEGRMYALSFHFVNGLGDCYISVGLTDEQITKINHEATALIDNKQWRVRYMVDGIAKYQHMNRMALLGYIGQIRYIELERSMDVQDERVIQTAHAGEVVITRTK